MKIDNKWEKSIGIYCIKNTFNNKCYIGSSKNIKNRLLKHRSLLRNNKHENSYLQSAWNKYFEENFICFLLELSSIENLAIVEQKWINLFGDYNLKKDVIRLTVTDESRKKMSETRLIRIKSGKIKSYSEKKIKKYDLKGNFIIEYNSVTKASDQCNISTCQITRVLKGKHRTAGGFQWKYSNDSKIIEEYLGRDYTEVSLKRQKALLVLDTYTGIYYEFDSYKSCGTFFNKTFQTISRAMKNKRNLYKNRYLIEDLKKQGELLGSPITVGEDNQQPSLSSNTLEGSTTNSQIQTDNAEDSNADTSALPGIENTTFNIILKKEYFGYSSDDIV